MIRNIIIISLAVAAVIWGAFRLASNKTEINKAAAFTEKIQDVPVKAVTLDEQRVEAEYSYIGTLAPMREVQFGAESQGKIVAVNAKEGDRVSAGQTLARIDDKILQLQLQAAQKQVAGQEVQLRTQSAIADKAQRDLTRFENLSKEEAVADINLQQQRLGATQARDGVDATRIGIEGARVQLDNIQEQIRRTTVSAPFSGVLTQKLFEVGSVVAPGTPLGTITDITEVKLQAMIPEADIARFKTGQAVRVTTDIYPSTSFNGRVGQVAIKGDANHSFKVEVILSNADNSHPLRAGMYARIVGKEVTPTTKLLVPRAALVGSIKNPQVYTVAGGVAHLRSVTIGNSFGDGIEIVSGLKKGEQVIVAGQLNLQDGTTVKL